MQAARPLGWGRFTAQFLTVALAYIIGSVPAVAIWGMSSTGLALSTVGSSLGGIGVAWLWLRKDGAAAEAFALSAPRSWSRALLIAGVSALLILVWFQFAGALLQRLGAPPLDTALIIDQVTSGPGALLLWIVAVAWFAAGFGEEMLWRGFLMDRLLRLKGLSGRVWPVIGLQALVFALPHVWQSWSGIVVTGAVGVLFGWLRTRTAWNLWPLIIAHAAVDTVSMLGAYAVRHGLPGL
ncbi:MAG: lysostaphin resistance A-like protein [Novosphingobium sp.]